MKIKFLKLWDLLGYFERTTSERPTYQKLALSGLLIIRGKKSQISRDFWGQNRGKIGRFRGNFQGKLAGKAIGKQTAHFVVIFGQISQKSIGFALIRPAFLMFF